MKYTKDMLDEVLSEYYAGATRDYPLEGRSEKVLAIRRYISELEEIKWRYEDLQR